MAQAKNGMHKNCSARPNNGYKIIAFQADAHAEHYQAEQKKQTGFKGGK